MVDPASHGPGPHGVRLRRLDAEAVRALGEYLRVGGLLRSVLRVSVVQPGWPEGSDLPQIGGRHEMLADGVRFVPHFPFERGVPYRARFDPRPLGVAGGPDAPTLEFVLPKEPSVLRPEVRRIFPSAEELPENLLRFYVCFSGPMRRGRAEAEVAVLGPDGEIVSDVLYRAPVELWDRTMRCLTVLLDPGRLKRGVGPNRELGPPFEVGQTYTLVVGTGMTDISGAPLAQAYRKRFRVTEPVREAVAVQHWETAVPEAGGRQPLALTFPRPLDWALLRHAITVATPQGRPVQGQGAIDRAETRWSFTPASPWAAGSYRIRVAPGLEDVCGNGVDGAFDRPLRAGPDLGHAAAIRSIAFDLA